MWHDPIVEETRKIREKYAASLGHDIDTIFRDIKERESRSNKKNVSFPPKRPGPKRKCTA
mgnify:CR=1 FL=1